MSLRRFGNNLLTPLAAVVVAVGLYVVDDRAGLGLVERLSTLCIDLYQRASPRPYVPAPVRIVDIDDASLAEIGQWPWPRTQLARLVDKLTEAGAAVIAFDVVFAEPDRTSPAALTTMLGKAGEDVAALAPLIERLPDHDAVLAEAFKRTKVVAGEILTTGGETGPSPAKAGFAFAGDDPLRYVRQFDSAVGNLPALAGAAKGLGFLNHQAEWDRVVRRVPLMLRLGDHPHPALAAEALRLAFDARSFIGKAAGANNESNFGQATGLVSLKVGQVQIPVDSEGKIWLHYTPPMPERTISAKDILSGNFDPDRVDGHIVLIGATFAGGNDFVATPLTPVMGGVEVHAQIVEQVLQNWFLSRPDLASGAEIVFMVVVSLLLIVLLPRVGALWGAVIALAALAGAGAASWYAFTGLHLLLYPVYPALVITIVYGMASLLGYMRTEAQQRQVRSAFSRYMSPVLVDQLARNPDKLVLGGEMRTMTLMFCDIRGFTTISEGLSAQELTHFINRFLSPMTEIILEHRGTIDKYIGDCIMAFWNAPLDDPDHARNAVKAAQAMRRRLAELNAEWAKEAELTGRPFKPVRIGIGINTGECCVGNMGSDQRFDYSVLGDAVNLASRLEGLGKTYGVDLVLGETTGDMLPDWPLIELDLVAVKGKSKAVRIHTLLPDAEPAAAIPGVETHTRLLTAYRTQDWAAAINLIEGAVADSARELAAVYELYRHRIEEFIESPPPANWDGVYVAKEK
jgi:adenylate cyclase